MTLVERRITAVEETMKLSMQDVLSNPMPLSRILEIRRGNLQGLKIALTREAAERLTSTHGSPLAYTFNEGDMLTVTLVPESTETRKRKLFGREVIIRKPDFVMASIDIPRGSDVITEEIFVPNDTVVVLHQSNGITS